jgi:Rrf2 family transcriptional repressor of oqxAB
MLDVRFSSALQMLLTLAAASRNGFQQLSSEALAAGIGSTSSLTRRLLVPLARNGIVRAKLGKNGGIALGKSSSEITLGAIYRAAVGEKPLLAGRTGVPHLCDVSSRAEKYFTVIAGEAEAAMIAILDSRTLDESLDELLSLERAQATPRSSRLRAKTRRA